MILNKKLVNLSCCVNAKNFVSFLNDQNHPSFLGENVKNIIPTKMENAGMKLNYTGSMKLAAYINATIDINDSTWNKNSIKI